MRQMYEYLVRVYDPEQDQVVDYGFRALTDAQAIQQAKDGYTGLLGNQPQDHLEVEVLRKREVE